MLHASMDLSKEKQVKKAEEQGKLPVTDNNRPWRSASCFNPDLKGQICSRSPSSSILEEKWLENLGLI